ncbi:hypothetical protein Ocin01_14175, partial [Orchesella cincta]
SVTKNTTKILCAQCYCALFGDNHPFSQVCSILVNKSKNIYHCSITEHGNGVFFPSRAHHVKMSRLEKAPSGETNTNTTKTSQFPRITVPKAGVGEGATLHTTTTKQQLVLDKNGNPLDPKLVEGHHEIIWARRQMLKKRGTTIPSNLAIPVGLAQIGIGASMAILGVLAIRYQSYLFYYGSGLWTGMVVGITGALCAMCTKSGLPKPKWFCGGQRWQCHVLLATTMLSLSASVLLAIFSTAGLLQTAKTMVGVDMDDRTDDDETLDRRRSAGNVINSLLLLSSMLEVLLSFPHLGWLSVYYANPAIKQVFYLPLALLVVKIKLQEK